MTTVPLPDTRQAAITIVTQVIRGDLDAVQRVLDAYDVDEFVPAMHASLALLRALALKLRSAEGLMAVDVWLAETSHDERRSRDSRIAAQRVLGHAGTCYPPVETITAAETFADLYSIGASTFNAACCQADYRIVEVFVAAMALWRSLLPGVNIAPGGCVVCNVAGQLWGGIRSAEPTLPGSAPIQTAAPKPEGTRTFKARMPADNNAEMRGPREQWEPDPPPTRPPLPAGTKVSMTTLTGLAELRRRAAEE